MWTNNHLPVSTMCVCADRWELSSTWTRSWPIPKPLASSRFLQDLILTQCSIYRRIGRSQRGYIFHFWPLTWELRVLKIECPSHHWRLSVCGTGHILVVYCCPLQSCSIRNTNYQTIGTMYRWALFCHSIKIGTESAGKGNIITWVFQTCTERDGRQHQK